MALNERKYDHDAVVNMWCSGATSGEIATRLGLENSEAVRTIVLRERKRGNPALAKSAPRRRGRPLGTKSEEAERILDMWAAGYLSGEIAKAVGCRLHKVGNIVNYHRARGDQRAAVRRSARVMIPIALPQPALVSASCETGGPACPRAEDPFRTLTLLHPRDRVEAG